MRLTLLSALLLPVLAAPLAHADNITFAYNDGTNIGTGTLTLDANNYATSGTFTLTSGPSVGSYTLLGNPGDAKALYVTAPDGGHERYDDEVLPMASSPLDSEGLLFVAAGSTVSNFTSSGTVLNLYDFQKAEELDADGAAYVEGPAGSNFLTFSPAVAATPEPSSLVLLGTGILAAAGAARRRFFTV